MGWARNGDERIGYRLHVRVSCAPSRSLRTSCSCTHGASRRSVRPDGFSYRTYASERTHLAITNFAPPATGDGASGESGEAVLAEFEEKLRSPRNCASRSPRLPWCFVLTLLCRSARLSSPLKVLRPWLHYLTGLSTASAKAFIPSLLARLDAGGLEDRDTPVFDARQGVAEKLEQTLWADQEVEVVRLKEAIARAVVVR